VLEDPDRRIRDRLLDTDHEFEEPLPEGRLIIYVAPGFQINDRMMFSYLERLIEEQGFEVVILDTYQRATPGISSFDDEKQTLILHRLANLTRKTGVTLIVLDHLRKDDRAKRRAALTRGAERDGRAPTDGAHS
jgi:AAA domain